MDDMPHTISDMLLEVSKATRENDAERLESIKSHVSNWMQSNEESRAQQDLIDTLLDIVYENE